MARHQKIWISVGAFVLAGAASQALMPAVPDERALSLSSFMQIAENGESGESGAGRSGASGSRDCIVDGKRVNDDRCEDSGEHGEDGESSEDSEGDEGSGGSG